MPIVAALRAGIPAADHATCLAIYASRTRTTLTANPLTAWGSRELTLCFT